MKEVLAKAESKMGKTIARLESDYAAIRAGRANPAVLDKVMVDYYGAPTPVNQLAAVSVAEARVLPSAFRTTRPFVALSGEMRLFPGRNALFTYQKSGSRLHRRQSIFRGSSASSQTHRRAYIPR